MRAILLSGGIALLVSLLGTRVAINQFTRLGYGQQIRDDGPTSHHTKLRHAHHGRRGDHPGHAWSATSSPS